jgi:hypothetical protein
VLGRTCGLSRAHTGAVTRVMQCSAVQCSAVQCSAVQCSAVQCSAVLASTACRRLLWGLSEAALGPCWRWVRP